MSIGMQIFDDLLDCREIIDSQIAHVTAYWREVEESNGNSSPREFVNQSQADLGGHHRNTADVVLHHSLGGLSSSAGVIIRVAENGVVTKLSGADFETLDHFRKERIFNVGQVAVDTPAALATSRIVTPIFGLLEAARRRSCFASRIREHANHRGSIDETNCLTRCIERCMR